MSEKLKILLVSQPSDQLNQYRKAIEEAGVMHDWIITLSDLKKHLLKTSYHGVLIDLSSRMQAGEDDKDWSAELESYFPCSAINWDAGNHLMRLVSPQWMKKGLAEFIEHISTTQPRSIRKEPRQDICLNLLVKDGEQKRRVNTVNVSPTGIYIWDNHWPEIGTELLMAVKEKPELKLKGKVVWTLAWGKASAPCGYGVELSEAVDW